MIGSISFVLPKPCTRCAVPTIHPITGAYDKRFEPLKTLRTYRSVMSRSSMVQLMMSRSSMVQLMMSRSSMVQLMMSRRMVQLVPSRIMVHWEEGAAR